MSSRVVLVAVDDSENAKKALNYYLTDIFKPNDFLVVCHVPEMADLPSFSFKAGIALPVDEWAKALQDQALKVKHLEDKFDAILTPRKMSYKLRSESSKNPGQGIIQVAEAEKAGLIVIGSRGLDRLRRTLLGSVSDYVVRHSKVPVLICPASAPTTPTE